MNKNSQRDEDRQIQVPNVFKDKTEGGYILIKKEEFKNLMECNKNIEETIATVERITICVCLIVVGIVIGMMWL